MYFGLENSLEVELLASTRTCIAWTIYLTATCHPHAGCNRDTTMRDVESSPDESDTRSQDSDLDLPKHKYVGTFSKCKCRFGTCRNCISSVNSMLRINVCIAICVVVVYVYGSSKLRGKCTCPPASACYNSMSCDIATWLHMLRTGEQPRICRGFLF
jgi:hypothetical protein